MRSKVLFFIAIATMSLSSLQADYYNRYANDNCGPVNNCCDGNFSDGISVYADWIYWRAHAGELDYATPFGDDEQAIGHVKSVCPNYDSGFRVGVAKTCDCWNFGVDYTRFSSDKKSSVTDAVNSNLAGTLLVYNFTDLEQGDIAYAESKWDLDYDLFRATAGYGCCSCGCLEANIFSGFTYARIDQSRKTLYSETTNITASSNDYDLVRQKWNFSGYGINFGFAPTYAFSSCIDVFGVFSYDAVVGSLDRGFNYYTTDDGGATLSEFVDLKDDCWNLANQLSLATGITYKFGNTCGCNFALSVGYEFHEWFNLPGFMKYQDYDGDNGNLVTFDHGNMDLGFNGLFVRLGGSF